MQQFLHILCARYAFFMNTFLHFFSVKCPAGTFYNASICQPCPFGQYQNTTASLKCIPCPEHTFTKRVHVKSLKDCIRKTLVRYIDFIYCLIYYI